MRSKRTHKFLDGLLHVVLKVLPFGGLEYTIRFDGETFASGTDYKPAPACEGGATGYDSAVGLLMFVADDMSSIQDGSIDKSEYDFDFPDGLLAMSNELFVFVYNYESGEDN